MTPGPYSSVDEVCAQVTASERAPCPDFIDANTD